MVRAVQLDLLSYAPPSPRAPAIALRESIRFGAVDWRHPEWGDQVWAGPRSERELEQHGLGEYAAHALFGTVCIRTSPAQEPYDEGTWRRYAAQLPPGFPCVVEAHPALTTPRLSRSAGFEVAHTQANPHFLDVHAFEADFWRPASGALGDHLAAVLLSFPAGLHDAGITPRAFAQRLEHFLVGALPAGAPFAVELREPDYLTLDYARVLAATGSSHVFSTAPGMPSLAAQARAVPTGRCLVVRLRDPVGTPYTSDAQRRRAVIDLLLEAPERDAYVLVDESAEGSAPLTIERLHGVARERRVKEAGASSDTTGR